MSLQEPVTVHEDDEQIPVEIFVKPNYATILFFSRRQQSFRLLEPHGCDAFFTPTSPSQL